MRRCALISAHTASATRPACAVPSLSPPPPPCPPAMARSAQSALGLGQPVCTGQRAAGLRGSPYRPRGLADRLAAGAASQAALVRAPCRAQPRRGRALAPAGRDCDETSCTRAASHRAAPVRGCSWFLLLAPFLPVLACACVCAALARVALRCRARGSCGRRRGATRCGSAHGITMAAECGAGQARALAAPALASHCPRTPSRTLHALSPHAA